ncbi:hypothetical protein OSTOST_05561 [Ostertagia ostertagi]
MSRNCDLKQLRGNSPLKKEKILFKYDIVGAKLVVTEEKQRKLVGQKEPSSPAFDEGKKTHQQCKGGRLRQPCGRRQLDVVDPANALPKGVVKMISIVLFPAEMLVSFTARTVIGSYAADECLISRGIFKLVSLAMADLIVGTFVMPFSIYLSLEQYIKLLQGLRNVEQLSITTHTRDENDV